MPRPEEIFAQGHGHDRQGIARLGRREALFPRSQRPRSGSSSPTKTKFEVLSHVEFMDKLGREYVIFGSVAISDGHVFLATATTLYCIGAEGIHEAEGGSDSADGRRKSRSTRCRSRRSCRCGRRMWCCIRARRRSSPSSRSMRMGRSLGEAKADKWAVGQLTLPAAAATAEGTDAAELGGPRLRAAPPSRPSPCPPPHRRHRPPAAPTKSAISRATVDDDRHLHRRRRGHIRRRRRSSPRRQADGVGRVRVFPPLPWKFDFEKAPVGKPPLTWIGAG